MAHRTFVNDDLMVILDTKTDLSSFTTLRIKYEKPNHQTGYTSALVHPSNNNYMYAILNFDIPGMWRIQAYAYGPSGKFHGSYVLIEVFPALAPTTTAPPTTTPPTT